LRSPPPGYSVDVRIAAEITVVALTAAAVVGVIGMMLWAARADGRAQERFERRYGTGGVRPPQRRQWRARSGPSLRAVSGRRR